MRLNSKEHHEWLERTSLIDIAKANSLNFQRILKNCLKANGEKVLIIGDKGYPNKRLAALMAYGYYIAAKRLGIKAELVLQGPKLKGQKADDSVVSALRGLRPNSILVLNLSSRLGGMSELGKSYRKFVKEMGHRFISATSLGLLDTKLYPAIINSVDVNYERMSKRGYRLKKILDDADELHITTKKGTNLHVNIKGKEAVVNDGIFIEPGAGGNLPAGEVYIAPRGKSKINGKIVIDGSFTYKEGTSLLKKPITLEVANGSVVNIDGGEEARKLENTFAWAKKKAIYSWGIKRIGEIGIGINRNAKIIGSTIIDEKTLGTAHVGIGSNYWFGGTIYATTHFDQVFNNPNVYADGKLINVSSL